MYFSYYVIFKLLRMLVEFEFEFFFLLVPSSMASFITVKTCPFVALASLFVWFWIASIVFTTRISDFESEFD